MTLCENCLWYGTDRCGRGSDPDTCPSYVPVAVMLNRGYGEREREPSCFQCLHFLNRRGVIVRLYGFCLVYGQYRDGEEEVCGWYKWENDNGSGKWVWW